MEVYLQDNTNAQDYTDSNWSDRVYDYLVKQENGYLCISLQKDGSTTADYYDENFKFVRQQIIPEELQIPGGFFEGKDYFYLV